MIFLVQNSTTLYLKLRLKVILIGNSKVLNRGRVLEQLMEILPPVLEPLRERKITIHLETIGGR